MINILDYISLLSGKYRYLSGASLSDIIHKVITEIVTSKSPSEDGEIHVEHSEVKGIIGRIIKTNYPHTETCAVEPENITPEKLLNLTDEAFATLTNL